jgi:hypothetical protein
MSYLNIYPHRIVANYKDDASFEGEFIYSLEQYGLLLKDTQSRIQFHQNIAMRGQWKISMPQFNEMGTMYSQKFVESLDNYIFNILHITPSRQSLNSDLPDIEIFFNNVYFDLSGAEPELRKIPASDRA